MRIGDICKSEIVSCSRDSTVQQAAELMRRHHVGDVVVVDALASGATPVGMLTDRDIVMAVIAPGLDPSGLLAGDVMSDALLTAQETDSVSDTLAQMRLRGIRRVPVIDGNGVLRGIVSADDLLGFIAGELAALVEISAGQPVQERRTRH